MLRLQTILRILKFASFNGKMNALNEINKVIANISQHAAITAGMCATNTTPISLSATANSCGGGSGLMNRSQSSALGTPTNESGDHHLGHGALMPPPPPPPPPPSSDNNVGEQWLSGERMARWIRDNDVLTIVLSDCMHQPQYVEKLERILRFLIKERALTLADLDKVWYSQLGKHEAIEKNVHDLLCKLAWDFTPEQLDHLFGCFQTSWTSASKKQQEKLLELIRSLSEDDKQGLMAGKVLELLWSMAHSEDAPTEIIDQAVVAHIKILDYSCSSASPGDKDAHRLAWLERCIEQLKRNKWVIVSLRHIKEILQQYADNSSSSPSASSAMRQHHQQQQQQQQHRLPGGQSPRQSGSHVAPFHRSDVIGRLQKEHSLIGMITTNLADYYEAARAYVRQHPGIQAEALLADGRFEHGRQLHERLQLLKYLLKEGQLWLSSRQVETVWRCLAQHSIYKNDREMCFKWLVRLMSDAEADLEPETIHSFYVNYVIKLDPSLLTDSGIQCFDAFFKWVNLRLGHLSHKRGYFLTESLVDLVGLDYLWKVLSTYQVFHQAKQSKSL